MSAVFFWAGDRVEYRASRAGKKPFQAGQLDLVVLNLGAQIIDGRAVRRRLVRSAGLCPGVLPHHIGDCENWASWAGVICSF